MNRVDLIGRTTADIELRQNSNNKNYCRFTIAVNRNFKKEDGTQEADFISCVAWSNRAEVMSKYVRKGDKIGISGRIQTGKYDSQKTGETVWTTDVIIDEFEFLEPRKDKQSSLEESTPRMAENEPQREPEYTMNITDDDLPF